MVVEPPVVGARAILAFIDAEMAEQHVSLAPGRA
jgi:hypothetical protein